jgi:peptidyl-prolyl cis-trans isomerase B (cyclophilin B)
VFAEVVEGLETADKIVNLARDNNDCPLEEAKMLRITTSD